MGKPGGCKSESFAQAGFDLGLAILDNDSEDYISAPQSGDQGGLALLDGRRHLFNAQLFNRQVTGLAGFTQFKKYPVNFRIVEGLADFFVQFFVMKRFFVVLAKVQIPDEAITGVFAFLDQSQNAVPVLAVGI
jgi:hypothetical protein